MSQSITALGITLSAGEWTAWSAIGTILVGGVAAIAAIIALRVPIRVAKDDRRAAQEIAGRQREEQLSRERRLEQQATAAAERRLHEVASAVYNALDCLIDALDDFNKGRIEGKYKLLPAAGRASGQAETLRILANLPGLSDGPIVAATSAAQSMDRICEAARFVTNQGQRPYADSLTEALEAGKTARARIVRVVAHHGIPVRNGSEPPVLPGELFYNPPHERTTS